MPIKSESVEIVACDQSTGEVKDMSVLEEADIAFDPTKATLDLTKEEKRRTTALMMAIQAYQSLIIKDADMYLAISREQGRDGAPTIKPATMDAMVTAAINFDDFISGRLQARIKQARDKAGIPLVNEVGGE